MLGANSIGMERHPPVGCNKQSKQAYRLYGGSKRGRSRLPIEPHVRKKEDNWRAEY